MNLLTNCISAKSAPQVLSKVTVVFFLLNFLIIGLCNSSTYSSLGIFLIPLSDVFYQKIYRILKQVHVVIHHILDL